MRTYKDTVLQLALDNAHNVLGGGYGKDPDGVGTIAWIYGVSPIRLLKDVDKQANKAWKLAQANVFLVDCMSK